MSLTNLQLALKARRTEEIASTRETARLFDIPLSTLRYNLKLGDTQGMAFEAQMRLCRREEKFLVEWILQEDRIGWPPTIQRVRDMATLLAKAHGDEKPIGVNWIQGFKRRNPEVKTMIGRKIDKTRRDGASIEALNEFFKVFEAAKSEYNVTTANTWNFDEVGTAVGAATNSRVMASSSKKRTHVKETGDREWVSTIECVSATGCRIKPLIIFKGASVQVQWFPAEDTPDWFYTHSENGWTSNQLGVDWLQRIFIPQTTPSDPTAYRILICDGHGSHATIEFMHVAYCNRIRLIFLPPHTSHVLQPLDLAIFGAMKSSYRREVERLAVLNNGLSLKKRAFILCYAKAREQIDEKHILAGFKAAGIAPFNPDKPRLSSQVLQPASNSLTEPITPPRTSEIDRLHTTPYKASDIMRQRYITTPLESSIFIRKIAKGFTLKDIALATAQERIRILENQLEEQNRCTKRKRIDYEAQDTFCNIVAIHKAQETLKAAEEAELIRITKYRKANPNWEMEIVSKEEHTRIFQSMQVSWAIDPDLV